MFPLASWSPFYEIVGSAAGALTGLQFVVMALIADMPMREEDAGAANAFATPTIVHFVVTLMMAALLMAPWPSLTPAALTWEAVGLAGLVYALSICRRMVRQTAYKPVLEDWVFHAVLPLLAYAGLAVAPVLLLTGRAGGLFCIAAMLLLLLAIGIHNAWDNVTYLVFMRRQRLHAEQKAQRTGE